MMRFLHIIWNADTKVKMSWLCVLSGIAIGTVCLLFIPPQGEISDSALWMVGQLLILAGALLGVTASVDLKQRNMARYFQDELDKKQDK